MNLLLLKSFNQLFLLFITILNYLIMSDTNSVPSPVLRPTVEIEAQLSHTITKIDNLRTLRSDLNAKGQYAISQGVTKQLAPLVIKHAVLSWFCSKANGSYSVMNVEIVSNEISHTNEKLCAMNLFKEEQASEGNWAVVKSAKDELTRLNIHLQWLTWLLIQP